MSVPSMVHRSGETLVVRSVITGDTLPEDIEHSDELSDVTDDKLLPECKIRRNYSCSTCDYFTQNPRHFLYHLRDVHKEKVRIYECPNCLYASKHFQKLLRHTKMVHGSTEGIEVPEVRAKSGKKRALPEEDPDLEENSNDMQDPDEEMEVDKTVFKCSLCPFTARSQPLLTKHEREEHIKTKFFRCSKCSYVTHMKARYTKHVKYHSMPMIKCDLCDFRTPYKWNLDRHCKNHNGKGAFKCSACNFTADIKQSLTVHEMNHHVPPVGQAAGLGVGRRRNKVGASDSTAVEEAAQVVQAESQPTAQPTDDDAKKPAHRLKIPGKKLKTANNTDQSGRAYGSDFIHPDDIIHHANGNIYIKNKCKLCNYKSAWDTEMAKHEKKVHNIVRAETNKIVKKPARPVPNLIPIPSQTSVLKLASRPGVSLLKAPEIETSPEPMMSQKDINDICAKSANSALKDLASLFGSEDVFKTDQSASTSSTPNADRTSPDRELAPKIPDLIPATSLKSDLKLGSTNFKQKNASFFDRLKEKLQLTTNGESANLTCQYCGHESKCLTESVTHQKLCGKQKVQAHHLTSVHNLSSTRCKYCRQRCKSSTDLINHLRTCTEALKALLENHHRYDDDNKSVEMFPSETTITPALELEPKETHEEHEPHPMENKVFVWNNIEVPMDIEIDENPDQPQYEYIDDKQDNVSLDLSIRTQSPCSESSYIGHEPVHTPTVTDKIPTHGTDISVAQHKRVFKCPHCTFWASTASRFHVHIVGHLNKKPFECSLCAYRSNWRWDITKHIKLKSVRDPAHESAKVLMTDETGRRNYTKYNKYLTEIHVTGDHTETSGGSGTRPKINYDSSPSQVYTSKIELPKLTRAPSSSDFSPLLRNPTLRPPPALKAADGSFFAKLSSEKKRTNSENKKTLWKCKKCNFRDASREKLLQHVKGHYPQQGASLNGNQYSPMRATETDEASVGGATPRGQAPFRCGHCHQVSNWKHVIQRHCRLKHSGDIKVVIGSKNGPEKIEIDEQVDEPDHVDLPQTGTFKCKKCPFSNNNHELFEEHLEGHVAKSDSILKCFFCQFFVSKKEELHEHLKFHGISEPEEYVSRMLEKSTGDGDSLKRYRCMTCPYVTNSKSQYLYHKQFHKPRGGQYTCEHCSYNVSKRHLLHQHLRVHGINISSPQKQNGESIDVDEISDEIEEISSTTNFDSQHFSDIPLVWVSKNGKFSKMFKCRFCPHVNLRKVNIQEHEKMHSTREKNPNSSRVNDIEHRCTECNYVCNNAGVLSSHSKVHQGLYGTIHCLVDTTATDEEQIRELSRFINVPGNAILETINLDEDFENSEVQELADEPMQVDVQSDIMYFCQSCPARFLKENEFVIHVRLHSSRLFYKCDYCSYTARQKPHILAHTKVHSSEYQERSKTLLALHNAHPEHQPPVTLSTINENGEYICIADENNGKTSEMDLELESAVVVNKPQRSTMNVPLSGTELFQQKAEAQQKQAAEKSIAKSSEQVAPIPLHVDPQFGTLMHGNPKFIYPTYLKNGRMKEKRYKCHKCPSAFEKREQYKVHLSLHGSKQKYKCVDCDYSVKYYANYVQHMKKHQMNEDAQAARKSGEFTEECDEQDEVEDVPLKALKNINARNSLQKMSVADQQSIMILQQRASTSASTEVSTEEKKSFWCPNCPYTNYRKDAVDNHQKKHISVSGFRNHHTCEHCDYSVPQAHFLRDHTKLHFQTNKMQQPEGYMVCDNLKLSARRASDDDVEENDSEESEEVKQENREEVLFEDNGAENEENRFLPPLSDDNLQRLNNNEGEKIFVNPETGEMVDKTKGKNNPSNSTDSPEVSLEESTSHSQIPSDN